MLWIDLWIIGDGEHIRLRAGVVKADAVWRAIISTWGKVVRLRDLHVIGSTEPGVRMVMEIVIVAELIDVRPALNCKLE